MASGSVDTGLMSVQVLACAISGSMVLCNSCIRVEMSVQSSRPSTARPTAETNCVARRMVCCDLMKKGHALVNCQLCFVYEKEFLEPTSGSDACGKLVVNRESNNGIAGGFANVSNVLSLKKMGAGLTAELTIEA